MHTQAKNVMVVGDSRHVSPKWRSGAKVSPFPKAGGGVGVGHACR